MLNSLRIISIWCFLCLFYYETSKCSVNNLSIIFYSNSVLLYTQRIKTQSDLMVQSIQDISLIQAQLVISSANLNVTGEYTTSIYNYDQIYAETKSFGDRSTNFAKSTLSSENIRFYLELACLALLPIFIVLGLIGYCKGNTVVILLMSMFLFILIIPSLILEGLKTSNFINSIDFCKAINNDIITQTYPLPGKDIGYYLSCPSKPVQILVNTALFQLGNSFNSLFSDVDSYMMDTYVVSLGSIKRNNQVYTDLSVKYPTDTYLQEGLSSLIFLNQILLGLEGLNSCKMAQDVMNYTEENFCYLNITYQFDNIMFFLGGILGLVFLTIGLNKLIVLLTPIYKSLGSKSDGLEKLNEN